MKFRNEMEIEKMKALKTQADYLNFIHGCELNVAVQRAREEAAKLFEAKAAEMEIEFQLNLKRALDELEQKLREECAIEMSRKENELEEMWKEKLSSAVKDMVKKLTQDFLAALDEKERELTEHFEWNLEYILLFNCAFQSVLELNISQFQARASSTSAHCTNRKKQLQVRHAAVKT